ncbi:MAG: HYR domain-containing protein [Acidobacteriia bacterium]|nr:HYR domain-containing protein [Terriglobia bacterium]
MTERILKAWGITCLVGCLIVALCAIVPVARAEQKTPHVSSITDGEGNPLPSDSRVQAKKTVIPDVTEVVLDKTQYNCNDTVVLAVYDLAATDPTVTLVSKDSAGAVIDTKTLSPAGADGIFTGSIATGSGIAVINGGSLTAIYQESVPTVSAAVSCGVVLDRAKYTFSQAAQVTVKDGAATSPASVTITSLDSAGTPVDTRVVSANGANGVFSGTIQLGSGITVTNGGSIRATYGACTPAIASVTDTLAVSDAGFIMSGGCDNTSAGADPVTGPLFNGGVNEFYTQYMDGGEYTAYTFGFSNDTGTPLTDVWVSVSFSGPGGPYMTALNNPVHVGSVPAGGVAGAVFQLFTDPSTPGLTSINLDFDVTAPLDGYGTPTTLTQVQMLQADDVVVREEQCSPFNTALTPWYESRVTGGTTNPWRWTGAAGNPNTVGSENRTDGICGSTVNNRGAMVGNSATTAGNNFNNNADSFMLQNFQPALHGNAPNGEPYHYIWKWHSFYHATETFSNTSGVWGAFYNNEWDSPTNPTGDDAGAFPIAVAYYYHTIFDYVGIWNWETANTGTPDTPGLGPSSGGAPNQLLITFNGVQGLATDNTWFAYGHEHVDIFFFIGTSHGTHRDIALDNDNLVYDEYYTAAQAASCGAGVQVGQVAFDRLSYNDCPASTAVLSVTDADAVGPIQVTVTSGAGDSEVVTLTGSAPYFSGNLTLSTATGAGANNGVLFVLPTDTVAATYTDASPAGTSTASATVGCATGDVVYSSNTLVADNGDNDGYADNNETVTMDITIQNNMATDLTNAKVTIFPATSNVDCVSDPEALYGTVPAGASATNPSSDRFTFHLSSSVACTDWQSPPTARFIVVITGDDFYGSPSLQTFDLAVDLDPSSGGTWTMTQNFNADPGWATSTVPDDDIADGFLSCVNTAYTQEFHWCSVCGNGDGGYGAWEGNGPFGSGSYVNNTSSAVYSPVVVANGPVTLQFDVAYYMEFQWDEAIVQAKVGAGNWAQVHFATPAEASTNTNRTGCSPIHASNLGWTGGPVPYTATDTATVPANLGDTVQFRWRTGSDTSVTYRGMGVDNVVIGNLSQTVVCEPDRNTCLPGCTGSPWVLTCPDPVTSECQGNLASNVTVPPATAVGTCGQFATITNSYTAGGADASGSYPLGTTIVTYSASDAYGNQGTCQTSVTVQDTLPPTISVSSNPNVLWPPNHSMASVVNTVVATDICDPNPIVILTSATSSEPDDANGVGDGSTINDIQGAALGTPDFSIDLRAERDGHGSGRVYTMTYQVTDSSGHSASGSSMVSVPHDRGSDPTEPLILNLNDRHSTWMEWVPVADAQSYDVVRGDLANLTVQGSNIDLGDVVCIDSATADNTTMGFEDTAVPAPGHVFFYVSQFFNGQRYSSYGTESAGKARVVKPNHGDCH